MDERGDAACWLDQVCDGCGAVIVTGAHHCTPAVSPVARVIVGFHQDLVGDWVVQLSCLHNQHVRDGPRIGIEIDCLPCAQAELPDGLTVVRTAGPFDAANLPAGLLRDHTVAAGTWGRLCVLEGAITFSMQTDPPTVRQMQSGDTQAIPPGLRHALTLQGPILLTLDFLTGP